MKRHEKAVLFELRQAAVALITAIESEEPTVIERACRRVNRAVTVADQLLETLGRK